MGGIGEYVLTASQSSERPNWLSLIIARMHACDSAKRTA